MREVTRFNGTLIWILMAVIALLAVEGCALNPVGISANLEVGNFWKQIAQNGRAHLGGASLSGFPVVEFCQRENALDPVRVEVEGVGSVVIAPGSCAHGIVLDPRSPDGIRRYKVIVDRLKYGQVAKREQWSITFCYDCNEDRYPPNLRFSTRYATGPREVTLR